MSEHEDRGARDADNPPQQEGDSDKGLGTETGASDAGSDVIDEMPEARGEVRYPDMEDPDEMRPDDVPREGTTEEDPDRATDAAPGADD